jgi:hypothetical protein
MNCCWQWWSSSNWLSLEWLDDGVACLDHESFMLAVSSCWLSLRWIDGGWWVPTLVAWIFDFSTCGLPTWMCAARVQKSRFFNSEVLSVDVKVNHVLVFVAYRRECAWHMYRRLDFSMFNRVLAAGRNLNHMHDKCSYRFAIYLLDSFRTKCDSLIKTDITPSRYC